MNVVRICGLVLVLLLPFENGARVESKAIGSVTTEELDNEIVASSSTEFTIGGTTEETTERTTTEKVPTLDRTHVTLAVPDELFSSTANLTLRLRDLLGQLLLVRVCFDSVAFLNGFSECTERRYGEAKINRPAL